MKKFYGWLIGLQLLAGSIWCLYYNLYLIGIVVALVAAFVLVPKIYALLKVKFNSELKAVFVVSLMIVLFISGVTIKSLISLFTMPDVSNLKLILTFEHQLNNTSKPCMDMYDTCFSKKQTDRDNQCSSISRAEIACRSVQAEILNVPVPAGLPENIKSSLVDARNDAQNTIKSWTDVYGKYGKLCNGEQMVDGGNSIKLDMANAIKSKYFMDIKIKKAKADLGI